MVRQYAVGMQQLVSEHAGTAKVETHTARSVQVSVSMSLHRTVYRQPTPLLQAAHTTITLPNPLHRTVYSGDGKDLGLKTFLA